MDIYPLGRVKDLTLAVPSQVSLPSECFFICEGLEVCRNRNSKLQLKYIINESAVLEDSLLDRYQIDEDQDIQSRLEEFNNPTTSKKH